MKNKHLHQALREFGGDYEVEIDGKPVESFEVKDKKISIKTKSPAPKKKTASDK